MYVERQYVRCDFLSGVIEFRILKALSQLSIHSIVLIECNPVVVPHSDICQPVFRLDVVPAVGLHANAVQDKAAVVDEDALEEAVEHRLVLYLVFKLRKGRRRGRVAHLAACKLCQILTDSPFLRLLVNLNNFDHFNVR